jgi:hypothetical protein
MATEHRDANLIPLTHMEAEHLAGRLDAPVESVDTRVLDVPVQSLVTPGQLVPTLAGGALGGALLMLLAVLVESGAWVAPGFAPIATASRSAAAVGGLLGGIGIGALIGGIFGMVVEWRRRTPDAVDSTAVVVESHERAVRRVK